MYQQYPGITPPPWDNALWRYMPYNRFVSLLDNSALWFTRVDRFDDEHEGSISQTALDAYKSRFKDDYASERFVRNLKHVRSFTLANCWHLNDNENVAMWDRYCKHDGIAVKTTSRRLARSLTCPDPIYVGRVNYIDYQKDDFSTESIFYPLMHKRIEFVDEREVRALSYLWADGPLRWIKVTPDLVVRCETGGYRSVDVHTLIQEIVVGPRASNKLLKRVKAMCQRIGLQIPIKHSSIDEPPLWFRSRE